MVNGPSEIWIERQGRLLDDRALHGRLAPATHHQHGRPGRPAHRRVVADGRRAPADGSRVNAIIHPLSLSGPLLTIRKFAKKRLGLQDMINLGSLSEESVDFLKRCIQAQLNVLISGGTGSGKTTL